MAPKRVWVAFDECFFPTGVTKLASEAKEWARDQFVQGYVATFRYAKKTFAKKK